MKIVLIAAAWLAATPVMAMIAALMAALFIQMLSKAIVTVCRASEADRRPLAGKTRDACHEIGGITYIAGLLAGWAGLLVWLLTRLWG